MIRMLPIVDALRNTSHMAGRRKELEEAGYDDRSSQAAEGILQYAGRMSSALRPVEDSLKSMEVELKGARNFMATSDFRELNNLAIALRKDLKNMNHRLDNAI